VVSRWQLLELGYSSHAIQHRIERGRLHRVGYGVHAVGRPELTTRGRWMAAVLSCGPGAALSHETAAGLWGIRPEPNGAIHVSVPVGRCPSHAGITIHRRSNLRPEDVTSHEGIPVTSPICTLVDLAGRLTKDALEAAINEADKLDICHPARLRAAVEAMPLRQGRKALRKLLERRTLTLADSALERRFLPLARRAGLPAPLAGCRVNGFKVDFYWPELRLVVETDGARYHRTPGQQTRDRRRDQTHTAAGLTPLRFTHAQVASEPDYVVRTLAAVARRLAAARASRDLPLAEERKEG
jgi:very-short-patch-repair endonuclease